MRRLDSDWRHGHAVDQRCRANSVAVAAEPFILFSGALKSTTHPVVCKPEILDEVHHIRVTGTPARAAGWIRIGLCPIQHNPIVRVGRSSSLFQSGLFPMALNRQYLL